MPTFPGTERVLGCPRRARGTGPSIRPAVAGVQADLKPIWDEVLILFANFIPRECPSNAFRVDQCAQLPFKTRKP
eukprot:1670181-Rhodomonas_salina.2